MTPDDPLHPPLESPDPTGGDSDGPTGSAAQPPQGRVPRSLWVAAGAFVASLVFGRVRRSIRRVFRNRRLVRRFGFGLLIVVTSLVSCSYGVDTTGLTAAWGEPVPATRDAAVTALNKGVAAIQQAPSSGGIRISLTEAEATSALSLGLILFDLMQVAGRIPSDDLQDIDDLDELRDRIAAEVKRARLQQAENGSFVERALVRLDPGLRTGDVQARFEPDGEIVLAGYVQAWAFRQPGLFVLAPSMQDGVPTLDFVEGRLGRLPLPEGAFDWLGRAVVEALLLGREYAEITEIEVRDGVLTFAARSAG